MSDRLMSPGIEQPAVLPSWNKTEKSVDIFVDQIRIELAKLGDWQVVTSLVAKCARSFVQEIRNERNSRAIAESRADGKTINSADWTDCFHRLFLGFDGLVGCIAVTD